MSAGGDLFSSHAARIRTPHPPEKVYKDECAYSFDSPESEDGLYISMTTFLGFGRRFVESYFNRTGNAVFLRYRRIKHEITKVEAEDSDSKKPTRLAIGMEGGFQGNEKKYDIEELYSIVVMPGWSEIPLASPDIPAQVRYAADAIIAADSAAKQAELAALTATWDGETRVNSKHAENLVQLDNGRRVPPTGWKCESCDLRDNLWLNLTDGTILCGRKFWDGTGGNNHAAERYKQTGYPLAVKLGTITPDGGDVYSYAEDEMVLDPYLARHLAHFGIDIMKMEKTDKTMAEMELDLNQREWSALTESDSVLQPVYGPGYTGIYNLGNSCYMNSVMQVIFTLPSFVEKFYAAAPRLFEENVEDPANDFNIQMAKFARGLVSGDYSKPPPSEGASFVDQGIHPFMFKSLIGKGHPEFSTKKQQDAQEFILHLFNIVERNSRGSSENPTDKIRFSLEDRIECTESHKVKYMERTDFFLTLSIPLEAATNKAELEAYRVKKEAADAENILLDSSETVRPRVSLNACLEAFASDAFIDDFYSSALRARTVAKKSTRLRTFPDYLFIHMQKFTVGADWVERKLDVSLDMPDEIDISHLRGRGKQPGEEELPEDASSAIPLPAAPARPAINENMVTQLVEMGFPVEACKKGVYHTKSSDVESAMNWVMEHMDDPDFADEFVMPADSGVAQAIESEFMVDNTSLEMIMGLGFTRNQAIRALKETDNNVERAADWVFSHMNELDQLDLPLTSTALPAGAERLPPPATTAAAASCSDGAGRYRLSAFISHMGSSAKAGHYVCHIRKDGRWIIFNDEKVALSEHPPSDLAYIYLYTRI